MRIDFFMYYMAHIVAVLAFATVFIIGLFKDWEGVILVFGIALLVVGCEALKAPDSA